MEKSSRFTALLSVLTLLLMLTHPALTLSGARDGLLLWSRTVLPTLLPFMICSNVIVSAGGLPLLMTPLRPLLGGLFGLSDAGGYVLVTGLLCGCPMGAKTCAEFLKEGRISRPEARYLLAIANHPSPMFVLGYIGTCLSPQIPAGLVAVCLYLPVLPLSFLARKFYRFIPEKQSGPSETAAAAEQPDSASFDALMMRSIEVMVRIGGYIMLFSILAAFIAGLTMLPALPKALALGAAEITTGIRAISEAADGPLRGLCLTAVTAFGGLSGILQTKSVIETKNNAGLSIRHYIFWKILHTLTACLLFILLLTASPYLRLPRNPQHPAAAAASTARCGYWSPGQSSASSR